MCFSIPGIATGCAQDLQSSRFACQPSAENPTQAFFPNIPDFYFDPQNAASFSAGSESNLTLSTQYRTSIFTIPPEPLNCAKYSVVGIQYCYRIANYDVNTARMSRIFEFLELSGDDLEFNITRTVQVESQANDSICSPVANNTQDNFHQVCCNITRLSHYDSFQITPGYTFGITPRYNQPLAFNESVTEYHTELFGMFLSLSYPIPTGANFTVEQQQRRNEPFFLLRFLLGKFNVARDFVKQHSPLATPFKHMCNV